MTKVNKVEFKDRTCLRDTLGKFSLNDMALSLAKVNDWRNAVAMTKVVAKTLIVHFQTTIAVAPAAKPVA